MVKIIRDFRLENFNKPLLWESDNTRLVDWREITVLRVSEQLPNTFLTSYYQPF